MNPSTRFRFLSAGVLSILVLTVGVLAQRAVSSSSRVAEMQEMERADTVLESVQRELAWLVEEEESRPFLHWSYHFVPANDLNSPGLARSPLAELPEKPLLGYFQVLPDGTLETPYRPRSGPSTNPSQQVQEVEIRLDALVEPLRPSALRLAKAPVSSKRVPVPSKRTPVMQTVQNNQFNNYASNASPEKIFDQQAAFVQVQQQAAPSPQQAKSRPLRGAEGEIAVSVEPFALIEVGDALVLHRVVSVGGQEWIQGLALDRAALLERVSDVEGGDLDWSGQSHVFAPPFDVLSASVRLPPVPGSTSLPLWGLAAITLLVLMVGAWLADRWMRATLQLAQQRTDFVAAVSHELRTPLTSIRMYADMLEQGMVSPDQQRDYHQTIRTESERLARLVDDVLAFSHLERVGEGGPPGTVGEAAEEVQRMLSPVAKTAGATLTIDAGDAHGFQVRDRDALVQILTNLVDNALKFSVESETKQVVVRTAVVEDGVEISVADRGPGVPASFVGRMFEPFVRGEREATRRTVGTGIGLALVAGLVRRLGGEVKALNRARGGLEVVVRVPAA